MKGKLLNSNRLRSETILQLWETWRIMGTSLGRGTILQRTSKFRPQEGRDHCESKHHKPWRWLSSRLWHRVDWYKFTNVSEVCTASIIRAMCCLHHHPDDGGSTDLWNVGELISVYKALQPRRQPCPYSSLWEPEAIHHKARFDDECSKLVDKRKEAKLQWSQDLGEVNECNLSDARREGSRHFRNNEKEYMKDINKQLESNGKNKTSETCISA
jgi:hypothetical protein